MVQFHEGAITTNSGYDVNFSISLTDDEQLAVGDAEDNVLFVMGDYQILGNYDEENECFWFNIPAELTDKNKMYNIVVNGETLRLPDKIRFVKG